MCWSAQVSGIFAAVYFVFIMINTYRKPLNFIYYNMFMGFYFIMEVFQCLQWLYGDVIASVTTNNTCSGRNLGFTYVAFLLIWLQPILFSVIGHLNYKTRTFRKLRNITIFVLLLKLGIQIYTNVYVTSVIGPIITCTFIGENGHLAWLFNAIYVGGSYMSLRGTEYLLYFFLCFIPFALYRQDLWALPLSWLGTLLITVVFFKVSVYEIASYWCFLSVFSTVIIFLYSLYQDPSKLEK
jgi:hypothetical protein